MTWCKKFGLIIYIIWSHFHFYLSHSMHYNIEHFDLTTLYHTWLGCIKSYMKYPSYGFHANRWFIYLQFINLGNPFKVIVHYLLTGRVTSLGHWDDVPIVSALVYMITHWTGLSHNISLSKSHDFAKLLYYMVS